MASQKKIFKAPDKQFLIWQPCWSPDGKRIAVIVAREATKDASFTHQADFSLKVISIDNGDVEKSMEIPIGVLEWPSPTTPSNSFRWSPNGKHILVSWASSIVFTMDSGRAISITKGYSVAEWAPNGKSVYYFDFKPQFEGAPEGLYAVKGFYQRFLTNDKAKLLASDKRLSELNIFDHPGVFYMRLLLSPKSRKLAMVVGAGEESQKRIGCLIVYDHVGNDVVELDKPEVRIELSKNRIIDHVSFSPDERKIACLVMTGRDKFSIETLEFKTENWKKLGDLSFSIRKYGMAALDFIGWHKALSWTH